MGTIPYSVAFFDVIPLFTLEIHQVDAFSEIILFKDKRAYDEFTSGSFEFGATAQAVAITAGAQAQAGTTGTGAGASAGPKTGVQAEAEYVNGMATFVASKGGLMYEFSVAGQKFTFEPL
jgi:hypothetical protein